ncbi:hypothetical protein AX16_000642 [Volvariella volvacea WC 439]|nr:hypothetical protein AX16_000642 [Volvariella volvacea WC 439]
MDPNLAQTYETLEAFIQSQKALLARTQSDIERLRKLRSQVVEDPDTVLASFNREPPSLVGLVDHEEYELKLPRNLDWSALQFRDPTPLQNLTLRCRTIQARRRQPSLKQQSELSDLQKLVKEARRTIIDPVLAKYECMPMDTDESEEDELSPEELRREKEREKIRELKKRRIQTCGLKLPTHGTSGVFIRHDMEDESHPVEISCDDDMVPESKRLMDIDTPTPSLQLTSYSTPLISTPPDGSPVDLPRARRPQVRRQGASIPTSSAPKNRAPKQDAEHAMLDLSSASPQLTSASGRKARDAGKPKSETYKQAWSVSEQNLLEQLLEQIPDGEKNRWQKISRAMNGRRTPRQVASRVQKYFEKLKRFGIGVTTAKVNN